MKDQLKLLEELQRYDARLQEVDAQLKALPEQLQALRDDVQKVENAVNKERAQLADTERFKSEMEAALKAEEAQIAKAKLKAQQVRTGREHMAAQREIETFKKSIDDRQSEILKLMAAIETFKASITAHEKDLDDLRGHVAEEEKAIQGRIAELEGKTSGDREARDKLAATVKPEILKRYGAIRIRRGLAVAAVTGGTCLGCHMAIPPQLYNTLQRGNTIELCPNCHRIIYWDEIMKDEVLERRDAEPAADDPHD